MTAAMLVLEPIFEPTFHQSSTPTAPGETPQAVVEVEGLLYRGHLEVVDADLADYFGSIPHAELLKSAARRIVDRRVLHLIKVTAKLAACRTRSSACNTRRPAYSGSMWFATPSS